MSTGYEDSFYVMIDGAPKMMSLDELVEAYEADLINGGTLVVEVGGSDWRPLSEVADLGEDDQSQAAPEEASPESVNFAPAAERRPAISNPPPAGSLPERRPAISNPPPVGAALATRPAISNPPPAGSVYPGRAPRSHAPISTAPSSLAPVSQAPLSTAPFVQDLDFGSDDMAFRKGRSKAPIFVALGVLAVGGGAFAITQSGSAPAPIPAPVVAAPSPVAAPTIATPAAAPVTPEKAATPSADDADSAAKSDGRLTDAMKEALLARDKERSATKKASGGRARAARSSKRESSGSDGVFRAGGSADDPLNSKL